MKHSSMIGVQPFLDMYVFLYLCFIFLQTRVIVSPVLVVLYKYIAYLSLLKTMCIILYGNLHKKVL